MQTQLYETTNLIVIESLKQNETKTGKQLVNKLKNISETLIPIEYHNISKKNEFYDLFEDIINRSRNGSRPILHLEIHGHPSNLGILFNSGELMVWKYLYIYCQELNINTNNNLFLTLAICGGAHLMRTIKPYNRCPWGFILGSFKNLYSDTILEDFLIFYESLIREKNVGIAFNKMSRINPNAGYEIIDSEQTFNGCVNYFVEELKKEKIEKNKGKMMLEAIKRTSTFEAARVDFNINSNAKIISEEDMIDYFSNNYYYVTNQMVDDFERFFFFWK